MDKEIWELHDNREYNKGKHCARVLKIINGYVLKDEISKASDISFHVMKHGESITNSTQRNLNQGHSMENSKAN